MCIKRGVRPSSVTGDATAMVARACGVRHKSGPCKFFRGLVYLFFVLCVGHLLPTQPMSNQVHNVASPCDIFTFLPAPQIRGASPLARDNRFFFWDA